MKKKSVLAPVPADGNKMEAAKKEEAAAEVPAAPKKMEAVSAVPAAAKKMEAAAEIPAAKKGASAGTAGCRPRKRAQEDSCDADLIGNLPDAILGSIISLLPTKDGARTQAIARRWRPLWRSAPLNIDANDLDNAAKYPPRRPGSRPPVNSIISRILSDHPGPVRRFDLRLLCIHATEKYYTKDTSLIESWLCSQSFDNLQEFHIFFPLLIPPSEARQLYRLSPSVLRFAWTLIAATFGYCDFPNEITPWLNFPLLKHLTLWRVPISEVIFHRVLSACHVLETLFLHGNDYICALNISSPTLRSIGFRDCNMGKVELVVEDTPHLERLICIDSRVEIIRIDRAPKLEILGPLSPDNSNGQIGKLVFQGLFPTSLKVLALQFSCTELDAVLDILRLFPCLEKLYVMWNKYLPPQMKTERHSDPLDPIKCLQTHLKKLVLKNYKGYGQYVSFAKFFVLNAEVLNEIKFGVNEKFDKKWVANQHRLLGVESKASPDAQFKFIFVSYYNVQLDIHDLSIADPFNNLFAYGVDALSEEAGSCD